MDHPQPPIVVEQNRTDDDQEVLQGLKAATGFLRRELGKHLVLRYVPELSFEIDDSIEYGSRMLNLIDQVISEDSSDEP